MAPALQNGPGVLQRLAVLDDGGQAATGFLRPGIAGLLDIVQAEFAIRNRGHGLSGVAAWYGITAEPVPSQAGNEQRGKRQPGKARGLTGASLSGAARPVGMVMAGNGGDNQNGPGGCIPRRPVV